MTPGEPTYAILFPGQLSEKAGMGAPLRFHPVFRRLTPGFNQLTQGRFEAWVTEAPQGEISERFTAPGIMVLYGMLCAEIALYEWGPPVAVAGYSLGFYAAAALAHCVPVSTVLTWIEKVNATNAKAFPAGRFAIAATTGLSRQEVETFISGSAFGGLVVSGVNNPKQVVFSGPAREVQEAVERIKDRVLDARILPLDVPLHTRYMEAACTALQPWWSTVAAAAPVFPLLSPVDGHAVASGSAFKTEMLHSLQSPTCWDRVSEEIAKTKPDRVLDLSPGGDLGRMTRWNARDLNVVPVSALWEQARE